MKNLFSISLLFAALALGSCQPGDPMPEVVGQKGVYNVTYVRNLKGFTDVRDQMLRDNEISFRDFLIWSTDSAWSLKREHQIKLKGLRDAVERPSQSVLLQKVIPLEDISTYMNNVYGGTVGGFVSVAADMRDVRTMFDVYWGLRLDYEGSKFRKDGAGYAVIRFFSPSASKVTIPYCPELGGTQPHEWPNGGGGFTTSLLNEGGYPEWKTIGYDAPAAGAELYEVTPEGREILRSVYLNNRWETFEDPQLPTKSMPKNNIRNGTFATKAGKTEFIQTVCTYKNHTFTVRALIDGHYHLTTDTRHSQIPLRTIEKGIWGIEVPQNQITDLKEITL